MLGFLANAGIRNGGIGLRLSRKESVHDQGIVMQIAQCCNVGGNDFDPRPPRIRVFIENFSCDAQ